MRRIRLVLAVAAMMVAMLSFSVPAMADVDLDDVYEERAELVEEYYEELGDAHEDGILLYDVDNIDDFDDIDVVYWELD
jgi:hypothetical protein